jgi:hypothetical protein
VYTPPPPAAPAAPRPVQPTPAPQPAYQPPAPVYQPPVYQQPQYTNPSPAEEESFSSRFVLLIVSAASNLVLIIVLVLLVKGKIGSHSSAIPDSIKTYISANLRNGYPIDRIRDALLSSGWSPDQFKQASTAVQQSVFKNK